MAIKSSVRLPAPSSVRSINGIGLTLLLLALLAALPLWTGPGLVNTRGGGDSPFLFFRLQQLMANLREGIFPARWMPDAAYGLGYPFFNYYASLPYYLAAIFNFLGCDLLTSIKIVQTLGFIFAGFAMYGWTRRHYTNRWASWLSAIAYVYAPYHLVNVYVRGDSLSEFYAFIFFPLILWSIDCILDSTRNWPLLALAYAGLILTHNVSALIFSPFVLIYCVLRVAYRSRVSAKPPCGSDYTLRPVIFSIGAGLALAFALSAFFWLPALGEASLVQLEVQTTGYFNYVEHFRAANLVQNSIGFDYSITTAPGSNSPFALGLVQAVATVAGFLALIVTWKRDARSRRTRMMMPSRRVSSASDNGESVKTDSGAFRLFVLIGLALSTFMITPLSKPLWDALPLLPLTQFPWRFLSIQALFASLAIGYLALLWRPAHLAIPIGLILVTSALFTLRPDYLPIRADEITPERLQLYEAFTDNIGTTIRAEYLPRTMIPRPHTGSSLIDPTAAPHPIVSHGEAETKFVDRTWLVTVSSPTATLAFPITYWPGWQADVNGQPVPMQAAPDLGYVQIDMPHGEQRVTFALTNTPLRTASEITSLVAAVICLIALRPLHRTFDWQHIKTQLRSSTPLAVIFIGAGFALIVWLMQSANAVPPATNDLSMDFVDKPWLRHNPGGIDFGAARLKSYQLSEQAGRVIFNGEWDVVDSAGVTGTLGLVAPSTHLFGGPSPLIEQEITPITGSQIVTLTPAYRPATGMYYVRVQIADRVEYLAPVWISQPASLPTTHAFGVLTRDIGLDGAQTQLRDRQHLDVLLQWAVFGQSAANYGISLRLRDAAGKQWASLDTQPGYGFQPTSAWQPGVLNDAYMLDLPPDLPTDQSYALDVILYRVASQQEVGRATIDNLRLDQLHAWQTASPPPRHFTAPKMAQPLDAIFGDAMALLGYDLRREGETLSLDLAWQARRDLDTNYKVFVHVFEPASEQVVAQWDAMPRNNAYPTSRWAAGEVVTETISISLTNIPPGKYRIAIGLYEPGGRLPVSGMTGSDAGNRRVILAEEIKP